MGAFIDIKKEIINKLSALPDFNKVYSFEKLNPAGFPAVFVTATGVDNEFFTNAENQRVYGYRVLILMQGGQGLVGDAPDNVMDTAEKAIQDLTDRAIDAIDSDYTLSGAVEVVFVEAAIGNFGYVEYEGGWARSAEIILKVHSIFTV
tara:strand:- start:556 stop:999 length:444 start_codon:yes stop_codon:yes gene_type:complete